MQRMWRERLETVCSVLKRSLTGLTSSRTGEGGGVIRRWSLHRKEPPDRRRYRRMDVDHDVSFWCENMDPRSAHLVNMSRNGLFLETDAKLEKGQVMKIKLPAMNMGHFPGISTGRVVRLSRQGVAVRCLLSSGCSRQRSDSLTPA